MPATFDEEKVKTELEKLEDDDFQDAEQEGEDEGLEGVFQVTDAELNILKADLANDFPEDFDYFSDAYIKSVASKPYSKDPSIRRPLDYSLEKLTHVLQWRQDNGNPEMEALVEMATQTPDGQDPDKYATATALVKALNTGSLYWHGFTKHGRPILWVRTNRKPWYPDVDAEVNALMLLADAGIRCMPGSITDFVVIAESSYPPPPNPNFMIKLLKALVRGYPDRLYMLYSAPVSSIVQFVMNLLLPLMPGRLASKVCLMTTEQAKTKLESFMDPHDVPDFFGGPASHDDLYPEEAKAKIINGILKFDFFGMLERLQEAKKEFES